ncbi:hypothetical protein ACWT_5260 [Actinoplanes sp. SE50]|nr:hypothetical protein ACPL_5391 [Actinoplanes sp. SE50/110]ATO84675.1 hypothetical protein ACWT_5260 [Actinoplanes sp. SE50]SLM02085.1 hypothetical protein ACSP50_5323 [Actinoplanes sp. SE50/110]
MTAEEAELSRIERFGQLPPRVRAEDLVEMADTRSGFETPVTTMTEDERTLRYGAG